MSKILILDIETSPNLAWVWRFYKENVGAKQVLDHTEIMSFAYKWLGERGVYFHAAFFLTEKELLEKLIAILDAADIVIAHNGRGFDLPTIQGRAMVHNLRPPSPYKILDTRLVAKYEFNFPSNSLEYLANILEVAPKGAHKEFPGFELWAECLKGNPKAWGELREYNIQDVETLEAVYLKMRPWIKRHPNVAVDMDEAKPLCPKCGSDHIQFRGFTTTNTYKYRKVCCMACGGWSRTRYNILNKEARNQLLTNTG